MRVALTAPLRQIAINAGLEGGVAADKGGSWSGPASRSMLGQVIGRVGCIAAATGLHLQFEVRLGGQPVDPLPWT